MKTDFELYKLLENSKFVTSEKNLNILKEGLENGSYLLINNEIITENVIEKKNIENKNKILNNFAIQEFLSCFETDDENNIYITENSAEDSLYCKFLTEGAFGDALKQGFKNDFGAIKNVAGKGAELVKKGAIGAAEVGKKGATVAGKIPGLIKKGAKGAVELGKKGLNAGKAVAGKVGGILKNIAMKGAAHPLAAIAAVGAGALLAKKNKRQSY